jgi:hypothetical protein
MSNGGPTPAATPQPQNYTVVNGCIDQSWTLEAGAELQKTAVKYGNRSNNEILRAGQLVITMDDVGAPGAGDGTRVNVIPSAYALGKNGESAETLTARIKNVYFVLGEATNYAQTGGHDNDEVAMTQSGIVPVLNTGPNNIEVGDLVSLTIEPEFTPPEVGVYGPNFAHFITRPVTLNSAETVAKAVMGNNTGATYTYDEVRGLIVKASAHMKLQRSCIIGVCTLRAGPGETFDLNMNRAMC